MKKDPLAPIIGKDTTTRGNPIAVASRKRYAGTGAAGFHESDKYERREKHKNKGTKDAHFRNTEGESNS